MAVVLGMLVVGCGSKKNAVDNQNDNTDVHSEVQQEDIETKLSANNEDEAVNEQITSSTDTEMTEDVLSFDENICGTFKSKENEGWEEGYWEICNIDGKYYLDFIGEYDFMAAEIELLDEKPYLVGDELRYMVKVYPFSGFAFAGEYQGAGQVMYIGFNRLSEELCLSADNPFVYEKQNLLSVDGVKLHSIQDAREENQSVPEIIGAWRCITSVDSDEYSIYMQFSEDGCVDIVRKNECYTPMVYRGIYKLSKSGESYTGTIEAEAIGMGTQPVADWILAFDPKSEQPIKVYGEYEDENPLVFGAGNMIFEKTEPGENNRLMHVGPWNRAEEVAEMYDEYLSSADAAFYYDFAPEYIEAIYAKVCELTNCASYNSYGIQDNKRGGEIWIEILYDESSDLASKGWIRYDFSECSYYDIYDNCLDEE